MSFYEENEYIPIYIAQVKLNNYYEGYYMPDITKFNAPTSTLRNLKHALNNSLNLRKLTLSGQIIFVMKGLILDRTGKVLFMSTIKREALDERKEANIQLSEWRLEDYVLFYSSTFFTNSEYSILNRRLQKEILTPCYMKGIEVRVMTSSEIEKNTFARFFEIKKTKSLNGLETYMSTVLPTILYTNGEDTFVENLERTDIQESALASADLSLEEEALLYDNEAETIVQDISSQAELVTEIYPSLDDPAHTRSSLVTWGSAAEAIMSNPNLVAEAMPSLSLSNNNIGYINFSDTSAGNLVIYRPEIITTISRQIELVDDTE